MYHPTKTGPLFIKKFRAPAEPAKGLSFRASSNKCDMEKLRLKDGAKIWLVNL